MENRKVVSTLEGMEFTGYRRDGNTTRQVDKAIQIIFAGHICKVRDHWMNGTHGRANKHLFECILKRISSEHNGLFHHGQIDVDIKNLELSLKK